jgi:hypothetical protein
MPNGDSERRTVNRETTAALKELTEALQAGRGGGELGRHATGGVTEGVAAVVEPLRAELSGVARGLGEVSGGLDAGARALGGIAEGVANAMRGTLGSLTRGLDQGGGLGSIFRSGLGLSPLAGSLIGLFRGGSKEDAGPALQPFDLPRPMALERANGPLAGLAPTAREAGGRLRAVREPAGQVVVNVQAMDSQSFMDRSHDIARAVRDAMLHMHPVNDVIDEL